MRQKIIISVLLFCAIIISIIIIWGSFQVQNDKTGSITITGSSVLVEPIIKACNEWQNLTPLDVKVEVADPAVSIRDINRGSTDIAMLARPMTWAETTDYPDLVMTPIGYEATAIVVSNSNRVLSLSEEQIRKIFSGQIKDWGEVGGMNGVPVKIIGREPGSSSRDSFRKTGLKTSIYGENIQSFSSDDDIIDAIRHDTNGSMIAYLPLSMVSGDLRTLSIGTPDGKVIEPTISSISAGDYPYVRTLFLVNRVDAREDVKALLTFISSPYGREILKRNGIIPHEKKLGDRRITGH